MAIASKSQVCYCLGHQDIKLVPFGRKEKVPRTAAIARAEAGDTEETLSQGQITDNFWQGEALNTG